METCVSLQSVPFQRAHLHHPDIWHPSTSGVVSWSLAPLMPSWACSSLSRLSLWWDARTAFILQKLSGPELRGKERPYPPVLYTRLALWSLNAHRPHGAAALTRTKPSSLLCMDCCLARWPPYPHFSLAPQQFMSSLYSPSMAFYLHPYSILVCLFSEYLNIISTLRFLLSTELLGVFSLTGHQYIHFGFQVVN